jgi:diguanylate cyclase (GGDEF)-like protein
MQPRNAVAVMNEPDDRLSRIEAQLREREAQLLEQEAKINVFYEFSSDWYWEQDRDFRFTVIKRRAATEERFPIGGDIGKTRWELPYLDVTEEQWAQHKAVLHAHLPFRDLVLRRRDAKGDIGFTSVSGEPVFDAGGRFAGYRGVGKDITERKHAEQRVAMEHAVIGLLIEANDPSVTMPNIIRAICNTLGWDYGAFWSMDKHGRTLHQTHTWHDAALDAGGLLDEFRKQSVSSASVSAAQGPGYGGILWRAWAAREMVWLVDIINEPGFLRAPYAAGAGLQSAFGLPIVAGGAPLGVIEFYSREVRQPDPLMLRSLRAIGSQIGMFYQRKQLEARQAMEHSVTRLLAESDSPEEAMPRIIQTICETLGWDYGGYWGMDEESGDVSCVATWKVESLQAAEFMTAVHSRKFPLDVLKTPKEGAGILRRIWLTGEPLWLANVNEEANSGRALIAAKAGLHSVFSFPIMDGKEVISALEFFSHNIRQPDDILIQTARSIGIQIGQFCRRKYAEQRIRHLAHYDDLTGLPNRTLFHQRLDHALSRARRNASKLAVLFVDLDRFKNINDTLGHVTGDLLLQEMGNRFKACLRECDTVARLGGDEFIILLEDIVDPTRAAQVARKILGAALNPFTVADGECHVTASVGISIFPDDGADDQSLMKHADIAMYLAKDQGKNNYQFYSTQINVHSFERLQLESNLRRALDRREFSLHYQAKADLKSGRMTGMEALLRWNHPDLGMVSPTLFIPLAEETGLIVPIGRWVINEACAHNKAWQDQGLPPLTVSVNLSARQFNDDSLVRDVAQALEQSGLAPQWLELEVTESMVMVNPNQAIKILSELKAMGISIAIDDFGIGYSSLSQLKRLPINTLKIDRSFIKDLMESKEDAAITGAIIAMGCALSLNVIAEGVETDAQVSFLREHRCDEMQGYYFSKPVPEKEFARLLRAGKMLPA